MLLRSNPTHSSRGISTRLYMRARSAAAELGSWVRVRVWAVGREAQPPRLVRWERDGGVEGGV